MSFIKQQRSWFFRTNAPLNTEGKKINLEDGSRPDQDLFERLTASAIFFTESDDRARLSTGGAIENEVGHVAVTTDAKAKAGTSGLEADRTLVTHAAQLPTSEADTDTVDDFSGDVLDVTADVGTTTRNRYLFKLAAGFKTWLISRLLPSGGTAGQHLEKIDGTDYNVQWATPSTGVTTTWNTLANSTVEVAHFLEVTGSSSGSTYTPTVSAGTINYMVIDKTVFLDFDVTLTVGAAPALGAGVAAIIRLSIDTSSIGTISNDKQAGICRRIINGRLSSAAFNNSGGSTVGAVYTSLGSNEIFTEVGVLMEAGATSLPHFFAGHIAFEID